MKRTAGHDPAGHDPTGEHPTEDCPTGEDDGARPERRRQVRRTWLLVGGGLVSAACIAVFLFVAVGAVSRYLDATRSEPWRERVVSVDQRGVCMVLEPGVEGDGGTGPRCYPNGLSTRDGHRMPVVVGQCVEMQTYHPIVAANRIVPCVAEPVAVTDPPPTVPEAT